MIPGPFPIGIYLDDPEGPEELRRSEIAITFRAGWSLPGRQDQNDAGDEVATLSSRAQGRELGNAHQALAEFIQVKGTEHWGP